MNDFTRKYVMDRMMNGNRDNRDSRKMTYEDDGRRSDFEDREDERDYYDMLDERRGVKGSGRGRRGNRRGDRRDFAEDFHDMPLKLTKSAMYEWKNNMRNTDGTKGEHFKLDEIEEAAEKLKINFKDYSEKEFCLAVNMIYSDFGHIIKRLVGPDKELIVCADFAKAYLDDPDGLDPSEKLAVQYYCMVDFDG